MNVEKGTTGIYAIINMINGKKYIGKAKDIKARNVQELSALRNNRFNKKKEDKISKHHLQNAWNKYGEENFIFIFLEECSEEKLNEREIYHVKAAGWPDHDLCYNITRGGEGLSGYTHKEETIEKIRIANSGENNYIKKMTPEELEEHLKKQSKSHSGDNNYLAKLTPEEREEHSKKQSERQTGRKMSVESSNKKSKSMKGDNHFTKKMTSEEYDEYIKKQSDSHIGQEAWNKDKKCPEIGRKGEKNSNAKLTERKVRSIKLLLRNLTHRGSIQEIAAIYNVDPCTIRRIKNGESWAHVKVRGWDY